MPCSSDQEQFYRHKDTLLADPLSLGQFFCVFAVVNHWNMFQVETALTQKKELDVKKNSKATFQRLRSYSSFGGNYTLGVSYHTLSIL